MHRQRIAGMFLWLDHELAIGGKGLLPSQESPGRQTFPSSPGILPAKESPKTQPPEPSSLSCRLRSEAQLQGVTVTIFEVMREEALKSKIVLSDADAEHVLWEHTGYPCFWGVSEELPTVEDVLRSQVREWAQKEATRKTSDPP